jgi:predicted alpha/beta-hydrolase family hydrolase
MRMKLHEPEHPNGDGIALTHGAGGNADMPLLVAMAKAFEAAGYLVARYDLAFRQKRPTGPPTGNGSADRESVREMAEWMRAHVSGRVLLGGQSYGGRQTTMAAGETPGLADGLVLFSYPLHPPGKPDQPRTAHFGALQTPALFVHGTKDPFGSPDEMTAALRLLPAAHALSIVEGAGHDLKRGRFDVAALVLEPLNALLT